METKFLLIEVPKQLHKEVKSRAVERGITMRKWILQAIAEKIRVEKLYE